MFIFTEEMSNILRETMKLSMEESFGATTFNAFDKIDLSTIKNIYYWTCYKNDNGIDSKEEIQNKSFNFVISKVSGTIRLLKNPDRFNHFLKIACGIIDDKTKEDNEKDFYEFLKNKGHFTSKVKPVSTTEKRILDRIFNEEETTLYPYCVYVHKFEGKVIYVGSGTIDRPYQLSLAARAQSYNKYVDDLSKVDVQIKRRYRTKEEAESAEDYLIKKYKKNGLFLTNIIGYEFDKYGNLIETYEQTSMWFRKIGR